MVIIPSLDIQNGVSRFPYEGTYNPLEIAQLLRHKGFNHIMITDLDGVFSGEFVHMNLIKELKDSGFKVLVGGGIRNKKSARLLFEAGADHIIIGTAAIKDQDLLIDLLDQYSDRLSVAIDTYETSVFIEGWVEDSDVDVEEFIQSMALLGVKHLIHTEIEHHQSVNICNSDIIYALSEEHQIHITPAIDITQTSSILELEACGYKDLILGGNLDYVDLDLYKQTRV